jgi:hypothetical protein
MTIKGEWRVQNKKNRPVCHSERSEESRALIGRIIIKKRSQFHTSILRNYSWDSSSPKSSFRMTIKGEWRVQNKKNRPVCHSERSEESRALIGRIIIKKRSQFHTSILRNYSWDSSSPKSSFRMTNQGGRSFRMAIKEEWRV